MKRPNRAQIEKMGSDMAEMVAATEGLGPPTPETLMDCGDGVVRPVLVYPSPRLRDDTSHVLDFDDRIRKLVADLATTMYTVGGIGLAAPQIGESDRVFVLDIMNGQVPQEGIPSAQLLVAVNPQIWTVPGKTKRDAERCLSFPDAVELVTRPFQVLMKAFNHHGQPYAIGCSGGLARAIQHEYDHLEGRLLVDYMTSKKARDLKRRIQSEGNRRSFGR